MEERNFSQRIQTIHMEVYLKTDDLLNYLLSNRDFLIISWPIITNFKAGVHPKFCKKFCKKKFSPEFDQS